MWRVHPKYSRFRFIFRVEDCLFTKQEFLGSAWRGAFGIALKNLVCITGHTHCKGCLFAEQCFYQRLFESSVKIPLGNGITSHAPHPFVLEPPTEIRRDDGSQLQVVGICLIGEMVRGLPLVTGALARAGERGVAGHRLRLLTVQQYAMGEWQDIALVHNLSELQEESETVPGRPQHPIKVEFVTPLRLKHRGDLVGPRDLTPRIFIHALCRRISELNSLHGLGLPVPEPWPNISHRKTFIRADLKWVEMARFSSRQGRKHPMGGLSGSFILDEECIQAAWPLLWHGQYLHVGKFISGGLGSYRITLHRHETDGMPSSFERATRFEGILSEADPNP